jgi:hypothetical protein
MGKKINSLRYKLKINFQLANVISIDKFYKHKSDILGI